MNKSNNTRKGTLYFIYYKTTKEPLGGSSKYSSLPI